MSLITTTEVELQSNNRLILFPWLHECSWSTEDKISCCLLHYTKFAQMYPKADLESISSRVFSLVEALFRAYQATQAKPDAKQRSDIIKIAESENDIVLTMLGLAVVITGKAGFNDHKVSLSIDILKTQNINHFSSMAINSSC